MDKDAKFDYILVDGRSRVSCLKIALSKIKEDGGILVLDNSERPRYKVGIDLVPSDWYKYEFIGEDYGTTTVWITSNKN